MRPDASKAKYFLGRGCGCGAECGGWGGFFFFLSEEGGVGGGEGGG